MIWTRIGQFLLILLPAILFSWLLVQELVPSGQFVVDYQAGESSPFIDQILPDQRVLQVVDEDRGRLQRIIADPAFFFLHPHRAFDSIEAEVWFYNELQPIVEFGGLASLETGAYDLYPLHNMILDGLGWNQITRGDLVLYEREVGFETIDQFMTTSLNRERIATYHAELEMPYRMIAYEPTEDEQVLDVSLRGFHTMKTYLKEEPLNFQLSYMDMNRAEGADPVRVLIYNEQGTIVEDVRIEDDGNTSSDAGATALKNVSIVVDGLPEGVYKMDWNISRDIFVRTVRTTQQYLVFMNTLFIADEVGYREEAQGGVFWSDAQNYAFQTRHAEGVQTVNVQGEEVFIEEPYQRYQHYSDTTGVRQVVLPYGDLEIQLDGYSALKKEMYFRPDPVRLTDQTDIDALGIDYVLTTYHAPKQEGDWLKQTVQFDVDTLVLDEGSWKFVFSVPNMAERQSSIDIGKMRMVWQREEFVWQDIMRYFYDFVEDN
jgi:hypothetical protein